MSSKPTQSDTHGVTTTDAPTRNRPTALVTGAARGIGRRIAVDLARDGYAVAVVDVDFDGYREFADDDECSSVADEIADLGVPVIAAQTPTTDAPAMNALVNDIVANWGVLDALVCNAGGGCGPLDGNRASAIDLDDLTEVLHRNLFGTITTVSAAVPALERSRNASIVTMGSITGTQANPAGSYAHYGITKSAVMHYTRYLANDLAPRGIRANCIAPGIIATGRAKLRMRESARFDTIPPNIGTPADVSALTRYLVSPESGFISGQIMPLYGRQ